MRGTKSKRGGVSNLPDQVKILASAQQSRAETYPGTRRLLTPDDRLSDHTVQGMQPADVTVNLFNYTTMKYRDNGKNDLLPGNSSHDNSVWDFGINKNALLLFGDGMIEAGYWNLGSGAGRPWGKIHTNMKGIVEAKLQNGYPMLNLADARQKLPDATGIPNDNWGTGQRTDIAYLYDAEKRGSGVDAARSLSTKLLESRGITVNGDTVSGTCDKASLAYLFDPNVHDEYKETYTDVKNLFQMSDDGYYYYDARENFAELTTDANGDHAFTLYDGPAVWRTDGGYDPQTGDFNGEKSLGNFFPFNKAKDVFDSIQTADKDGNPTNILSSSESKTNVNNQVLADHHMGMTMTCDFVQPLNGRINAGTAGSVPMTFEFSGDDDVWVFVDDVLVLDIGGIHSELYGTIDFSTGDVYVGQSWRNNGAISNNTGKQSQKGDQGTEAIDYTTLKDLFTAANVADDFNWNGNTFASNSSHTLKMFYLERGNYDSSLKVRFNLQSQLYHQIKKVDQNGAPLEGVEFELYDAALSTSDDPSALSCRNASGATADHPIYVKQSGADPLTTLTTDENGIAQFATVEEGKERPFNFADRYDGATGEGTYYILKEVTSLPSYRSLPTDIVFEYNPDTSMLIVANRWTTGSYASFTSTITGNQNISYGRIEDTGEVSPTDDVVQADYQKDGLVVAIPAMRQDDGSLIALYGDNLSGFRACRPGDRAKVFSAAELRKAALKAALYQMANAQTDELVPAWYLSWNDTNGRLEGTLSDLPGRADRYELMNSENADMRMVYAVITPSALQKLGVDGANAAERYEGLGNVLQSKIADGADVDSVVDDAADEILSTADDATANNMAFSFLNVGTFQRTFRSLIYVPNEQRELRVQKISEDGVLLNGAEFSLFKTEADAKAGTDPVASGTTARVGDEDGVLVFSPHPTTGEDGGPVAGYAQMIWPNTGEWLYLKETKSPSGYRINDTIVPVVVGRYSIYADAGSEQDGITVMAGVGKLTQTMVKYASDGEVNITLQDISAYCQQQDSGAFDMDGWKDSTLEGTSVKRSMNLHYGMNALVDYGRHDSEGGANTKPFFIADTGFIRARVEQNLSDIDDTHQMDQREDLKDSDITSLFSLLNTVVVTDAPHRASNTGRLAISKKVVGGNLEDEDYTRNFSFEIALTDAQGKPLGGEYNYIATDKAGQIKNGDTLLLHHDEGVVILGLPVGTHYVVKEKGEEGWFTSPTSRTFEGVIEKNQTIETSFENSRNRLPDKPVDPDDPNNPGDHEGGKRPSDNLPGTGDLMGWTSAALFAAGLLCIGAHALHKKEIDR